MEQFYGGEMHHGAAPAGVVTGFHPMDGEDDASCGGGCAVDNNLLDDGPMSFYATDFPPLPDFPCMSSSSSSSSTRAPVKATSSSLSSSASSAASWAVLRSDHEADRSPQMPAPAPFPAYMDSILSGEAIKIGEAPPSKEQQLEEEVVGFNDCVDMMETFGYMDLLECNDLFAPSTFHRDEPVDYPTAANNGYPVEEFQPVQHHMHPPELPELQPPLAVVVKEAADEMGQVLLEWLRNNRNDITAEDLRRVKVKKATIEAAAQRLGGGKDAMKQLLKLILEWVQTNHLHRKQKEAGELAQRNILGFSPFQELPEPATFQNLNPKNGFCLEPASCFPQAQWPSPYPPSEHAGSGMAAPVTCAPSNVGFMIGVDAGGDPFSSSGDLYSGAAPGLVDYHMLDSPAGQSSWLLPQFGPPATNHYSFMTGNADFQPQAAHAFAGYPNNPGQYSKIQQQYYGGGNNGAGSLMRLGSSATKEARKKRMARQRRLVSHHHTRGSGGHNGNHQNGHHQAVMAMDHQQHASTIGGCDQAGSASNTGNWMYWPAQAPALPPPSAPQPMVPPESVHVQQQPTAGHGQTGQRGQVAPDRRQGWKPESNLKFLLQKVLKQSDVGSLGRIVLPKKEAETHLPELEARDGITISMEDIGTSRVWNMRYRFWPNNKSRMYLLENTGDFVRANGLQEGDFIVIYSDVKCGKYLIRGVKVRQTEGGPKPDPRRNENSKLQRNGRGRQGSSLTASSYAAWGK
ncbi:hypothetical protein SAY86_015873 [Trapa natans]|uniref:TF-B3 domain-containing protein n=1 Tax=Trapa natans TaxID=22666 RepID=A0AAN7QYY2_TRANT|nr:hypothetical protein SAY86_015873 [Trapa natans]